MTRVDVRPRRDDDLPALAALLAEQQPTSHYPFRWPLPFPVEDFIVRPTERLAWVATLDHGGTEVVAGHVMLGRVDDPAPFLASGQVPAGSTLAEVSVLFTGLAARGHGVGGRLLDTAVAAARAAGHVPVLDVVPTHESARAVYLHRGWTDVGRSRFDWLPADVDDVFLMALL